MRPRLHVALALAMLAGCGRSSGFLPDASSVSEHAFRMEISAERYSRSVSGSSSVGSLFCLIPMGNGAYKDAMAALHAEAKLRTNEVLENVRADHAFLPFLLYCDDQLIVSADVYQVTPAGTHARSEPPPEAAASFGTSFSRASASDSFSTPSNPYVISPGGASGADAGPRDPETCERAFAELTPDMPSLLRTILPNARFMEAPPKAAFLAACTGQVDDVQLCLKATFLRSHMEPCRGAFRDLSSDQRARLFGAFLREW
jgi:hypothetical protein